MPKNEELLLKNRSAWDGVTRADLASPLDSSLKKNTAFMKKARIGLNQENLASLLSDVRTLSLEKYLTEVVSAVVEGIGKVRTAGEISAAVEVVSSLHQRFAASFTTILAYQLVRSLSPPPATYLASLTAEQREKEESSRVTRQRNLIKIVTEFWLVGIFRTIQDALDGAGGEMKKRKMEDALPLFCLRELLGNDREFTNLSIATAFSKSFSFILSPGSTNASIDSATHEKLRGIVGKYYQDLAVHLQRQVDHLSREKARVEESTVTYGSAPTTREVIIIDLQRLHDKQFASAQTLGEALKLEPLVLRDPTDSINCEPAMIRGIGGARSDGEQTINDSLWDDEEQKRFYEVLLDLTQVVPSDMLCEDKPLAGTSEAKDTSNDQIAEPQYDDSDLEEPDNVEADVEIPSTSVGVKVHNLLIRLPEMTNRESIDNCAVEFSFLNSKASRNRLIKALLEVNIARTDLLPYYARLIATLNQYLTSIATSVIAHLHKECRRFTAGKGLRKDVPKRLFNIRYLSELIKFGIVPVHVSFHCMKIILDAFTKFDVEVLAAMLEHCGRFLLRSPETASRMENMLAVVMRKAQNISGMERTLVENAFYYVNPPDQAGIPQVERPPFELFIDKVIYADLGGKTHDQVLKYLKRLDWNDVQTTEYLAFVFSSPWLVNYSTIQLLAFVLAGLSKHHPEFMVRIIDATLEAIRLGLEENIYHENQRRIASIKYLGELQNCRLVDGKVVLDVLYLCLSFGTPQGRPIMGGTALDPVHDFFRIRLILTLLESCITAFGRGTARDSLDLFLCHFQYYLKTKNELAKDVEYDVSRILSILRPGLRVCATTEEAESELNEALSHINTTRNGPAESRDSSSSSDGSTIKLDRVDLDDSVEDVVSVGSAEASDDEQDFILLEKKREQDDLDKFAEEDLDREFSKMMNESLEVRKQEVKRPLEIVVPRRSIASHATTNTAQADAGATDTFSQDTDAATMTNQKGVKFTFLSRKSKPRALDLPSDSPLALHNAAHRIAEEREKQTIRDLTLKYEVAQSREELEDGLSKSGVGVKYLPIMLAGQKGGSRSGSIFKMGARDTRTVR